MQNDSGHESRLRHRGHQSDTGGREADSGSEDERSAAAAPIWQQNLGKVLSYVGTIAAGGVATAITGDNRPAAIVLFASLVRGYLDPTTGIADRINDSISNAATEQRINGMIASANQRTPGVTDAYNDLQSVLADCGMPEPTEEEVRSFVDTYVERQRQAGQRIV